MLKPRLSVFLASFFVLTLTACGSAPTFENLEVTEVRGAQEDASKTFSQLDDAANIYVRMNDNWWGMIATLWANDEEVGIFDHDSFLNFSVSPGVYDFRVAYDRKNLDTNRDTGYLISRFDLNLDEGAVALIDCDRIDLNVFGYQRSEEPVLQPHEQCNEEFNSNKNGIQSCTLPYPQSNTLDVSSYGPYGYDINYTDTETPLASCKLVENTDAFASMDVSQPYLSQIYNDSYVFERAVTQNTIDAYQNFIRDWPESRHVSEARATIAQIDEKNEIDARENQITEILERDSALPLQAQRDKYMIALTGYLQNQDFEPSLLYFELLDRLEVELSPSITHFWGEALLRTGQPEAAIAKLYEYINIAGTNGTYYRDALTLINEAESQ